MRARWGSAIAAAAILAGVVVGASPATAAEVLPCTEYPVTVGDSDGDGITDLVESAVCGTATCADGTEDPNGDGRADAAALQRMLDGGGPDGSSRSARCQVKPHGELVQLYGGRSRSPWWPRPCVSVIVIRRGRAQ